MRGFILSLGLQCGYRFCLLAFIVPSLVYPPYSRFALDQTEYEEQGKMEMDDGDGTETA